MNHLKRLDTIGNFGIDMITAAIGVLLLTRRYTGWTILYVMTVILSFGIPVFLIVSIRSGAKPAGRGDFLLILFNLIFGVSILQFPDRFMIWMHVFFGWWMIGRGILALIESHICRFDQLSGAAEKLLLGIISVLLGLFMIFGGDIPVKNQVLSLLAGVYFIVYGLLSFLFHLSVLLKAEYPKMRSVSFSMSILFSAFLPVRFYISIRQLKNSSRLEVHHAEPADLNVYIYIKGKGPEMFGHMDIGYQGTIWSYGNHDPKTRKLGGTYGDGVLIRADEKLFLQESITTDGKTVIAYGLKLSDEQKAIVEKRIDRMMERTVPWKCAAALCHEAGEDMNACQDYASRVYKETFCDMYKFTNGKFRTYFISATNCVILADELIRSRDLSLVDLTGFVTPGAYLSFLNTEYLKQDSIVVSRTLYEAGVREPLPEGSSLPFSAILNSERTE